MNEYWYQVDCDGYDDGVADYLSDQTGWCVESFMIEV